MFRAMHLDETAKNAGGATGNSIDISFQRLNTNNALIGLELQVCLFELHYLG